MIVRLAHVCFRSRNFDAMVAFYRDVLGFPVRYTFRHPDGNVFGMFFEIGETTYLELFDEDGAALSLGKQPVERKIVPESTYQHFCLQTDNLAEERKKLVSKGIDVTEIKKGTSGSLLCWIKDPDGNPMELMEYTADTFREKRPE